ncbi:MAG: class I SAM-dependent methyltransferase [Thermoplasmata archaeon]
MAEKGLRRTSRKWAGYYRWTAARPPRELLLRTLDHIGWEKRRAPKRRAVELGFGAGTDTLELLHRGWQVLAIDREDAAARFLDRRVPTRDRSSLTTLIAPLEGIELPRSDLIYASYSLPFCSPAAFPALWSAIRSALVPGGHFAGQLFGDRDEWVGQRPMTFHRFGQIRRLTRGYKVELCRETVEEGQAYDGPKRWHFFDLILEKMRAP